MLWRELLRDDISENEKKTMLSHRLPHRKVCRLPGGLFSLLRSLLTKLQTPTLRSPLVTDRVRYSSIGSGQKLLLKHVSQATPEHHGCWLSSLVLQFLSPFILSSPSGIGVHTSEVSAGVFGRLNSLSVLCLMGVLLFK